MPRKRPVATRIREQAEKLERLKDEERMEKLREKIRTRRPVRRR